MLLVGGSVVLGAGRKDASPHVLGAAQLEILRFYCEHGEHGSTPPWCTSAAACEWAVAAAIAAYTSSSVSPPCIMPPSQLMVAEVGDWSHRSNSPERQRKKNEVVPQAPRETREVGCSSIQLNPDFKFYI